MLKFNQELSLLTIRPTNSHMHRSKIIKKSHVQAAKINKNGKQEGLELLMESKIKNIEIKN